MDPTIELSDDVRHALQGKNFWHLATVNPTGSPQVTTVWVHTREGKILVNSALGRVKPRNIEHNPRVALSWHEHHEGGYHSMQIQGHVVETIVGDQAEADIDSLAEKYIGQTPYPWRGDGERRVSFLIEPTHAMVMGG